MNAMRVGKIMHQKGTRTSLFVEWINIIKIYGRSCKKMQYQKSNMSIGEQTDLQNAKALKEKVETQNLLIQYLAEMSGVYIPTEESEVSGDVQNIEEVEE